MPDIEQGTPNAKRITLASIGGAFTALAVSAVNLLLPAGTGSIGAFLAVAGTTVAVVTSRQVWRLGTVG